MFLISNKLKSKIIYIIDNLNPVKLAWFYLILPNFLLALMLTRNDPKYIFLIIPFLIFSIKIWNKSFNKRNLLNSKEKLRGIITALIMTFFITYIIGGLSNNIEFPLIKGGINLHNDSDWFKHYAVFNHLKDHGIGQSELGQLRYYIGFYLISIPFQMIFKTGLEISVLISLFVFILLLFEQYGVRWEFLLVLLLMGGLEYIGYTFIRPMITGLPIGGTPSGHYEWWAIDQLQMQITSMSSTLRWVPQHGLPAWISVLLLGIIREDQSKDSFLYRFSIPILLGLFSPFAAIGIIPFIFKKEDFKFFTEFKLFQQKGGYFILLLLIGATPFFYFYSPEPTNIPYGWVLKNAREGAWKFYLIIILLEVIIAPVITMLASKYIKLNSNFDRFSNFPSKGFVIYSFFVVLIITQISAGMNNDWSMRVTIPALFIIYLYLTKFFLNSRKDSIIYILCLPIFLAIFMPNTSELARTIYKGHAENVNFNSHEHRFENMVQNGTRVWNDWLRHQYMRPGTSERMYCEIPSNCPDLYP